MLKLETVIKRSNNNFDLIRLIAALAVVFGHSFSLFKNGNYHEPIQSILITEYSGSLAVYVFFFLSGIFITSSFYNKKNHVSFIIMRFFRIWPALVCCTLFTVFVVGPLLTTIPTIEYFKARLTWNFLFCNTVIYNIKFILPGLFENNYYKSAVNGSLWTLPVEITCYTTIFLLGSILSFKNKWLMICFFVTLGALFYLNSNLIYAFFLHKVYLCFFAGCTCYLLKKYIIVDYRLGIILMLICFIFKTGPYYTYLFIVCLLYSLVVLGAAPFFKKIRLPGDYSYGIYIYGFLVQQIFAHFFPSLNPYISLLFTVPVVFLFAALSWHIVENRFIQLGRSVSDNLLKSNQFVFDKVSNN